MVQAGLQQLLLADVAKAIEQSKTIQCDYLGFKEQFRLKYPNEVKNIDWRQTYLDSTVNISVESTLTQGAMMDYEAEGHNPGT